MNPRLRLALAGPGLPDSLGHQVAAGLRRGLSDLLISLGMPGHSEPTVILGGRPDVGGLTVTVEGAVLPVPEAVPYRVDRYLRGELNAREVRAADVVERLVTEAVEAVEDAPERRRLAQFVTLAGQAALAQQPSLWFDCAVFDSWWEDAGGGEAPEGLPEVIRELLDMGVSIADRVAVRATLDAVGDADGPEITEALRDALAPEAVVLRIDPHLLRRATARGDARAAVEAVDDSVFGAVGLPLPRVRIVPDPTLPRDCFSVAVNHLPGAASLGLPAGTVLLHQGPGSAHLLDLCEPSRPLLWTTLPGSGEPALVVDETLAASLGTVVLDVWQHIVQTIEAEVRAHAWRLVSRQAVLARLEALRYGTPSLVDAVEQRVGALRLIRIVRVLVAEGAAVSNMLRICDEILLGPRGAGTTWSDDREVANALLGVLGATDRVRIGEE